MNQLSILAASVMLFGVAHAASVSKSTLVECTAALCGGFVQNVATQTVAAGTVSVSDTGRVKVSIVGLRDKATGQLQANKKLMLHFGTMFGEVNATYPLGLFTTDAVGNYTGPARYGNGRAFKFPPGIVNQGSFYVNDPAAASTTQFATGFAPAALNYPVDSSGTAGR